MKIKIITEDKKDRVCLGSSTRSTMKDDWVRMNITREISPGLTETTPNFHHLAPIITKLQ